MSAEQPSHGPQPAPEACLAARELLLGDLVLPTRPVMHCEACAQWFERARRQALALGSLARLTVEPRLLDGRVVAELNAGARQERAAATLALLSRASAPESLREGVAERLMRLPPRAPRELDQRVAVELSGRTEPRVERALGVLTRRTAPLELDRRVAQGFLAAAGTRVPGPTASRGPLRPALRWLPLAAGLVLAVGAISLAARDRLFRGEDYGFQVVHTASVADLDPFSRGLLAGASGWVDAPTSQASPGSPASPASNGGRR